MRKLLRIVSVTLIILALGACGPAQVPPTVVPTAAPAAVVQPTTAPPTVAPVVVPPTAVPPTAVPVVVAPPTAKGTCGTLKLLWWQAPTILNSHLAQGQKDFDASRLVYESLAATNEKGEPDARYGLAAEVPTLANGGIAKDGTSMTWKLKQGVKWSDGSAFTADDVVFTYKYVSDEKTAATTAEAYTSIKSVEKVDDNTVKITFKEPNPNPYQAFVGLNGNILQKKSFENFMGEKAKDAPGNLRLVARARELRQLWCSVRDNENRRVHGGS